MDINKIVDKALEREMRNRKVGVYYISEIPYCMRKIWFTFKKPKRPDKRTLRIMERGNVWHAWIAKILAESDMILHHEEETRLVIPDLEGKLLLRGRVDDFIIAKNESNRYVLEIKTTANIWKLTEPHPHHLMQIMPYLLLENCDGKLVYIDTRYLDIKVFDVKFDWNALQNIIKRARKLHKYLTENEIPPPEAYDKGDYWECKYCPYYEECQKFGRGEGING